MRAALIVSAMTRRASRGLPTFDFTACAPGAVSLPQGLMLTRASAATVQTGPDTVQTTGIGPNVARVGQYTDATSRGLVVEPRRTNLCITARAMSGPGWATGVGTPTPNAGLSPDGVVLADRFQSLADNYSNYYTRTTPVGDGTVQISLWGRAWADPFVGKAQLGLNNTDVSLTATWQRFSATYQSNAAGSYYITPQNAIAPGPQDALWDLYQIEVGGYVTEWIPEWETHEADQYTITEMVASQGRVSVEITFIPKGSRSTYSTDPYLLFGSSDDYLRISRATGAVTCASGGDVYTTDLGFTWSAHDTVRVYAEWGGVGAPLVVVQINSALPLLLSIGEPVPLRAWTAPTCGLLGNAGADVFACWLRRCQFFGAQGEWT